MLTVMYRDVDGVEVIHEAGLVRRRLDRSEDAAPPGVEVHMPNGDVVVYGEVRARQSGDVDPEVFVMNSEGQTVARYRL